MKKMIIGMTVVVLAFGFVGSSFAGQASGSDYYGEGKPEISATKQAAVVYAAKKDCVDYDTFYSEGANSKCLKGRPTVVQPPLFAGDFSGEGRSEAYSEVVAASELRSRALEAVPAAGQ